MHAMVEKIYLHRPAELSYFKSLLKGTIHHCFAVSRSNQLEGTTSMGAIFYLLQITVAFAQGRFFLLQALQKNS